MSVNPETLKGIVRNGVIVFVAPYPLPDGTEVMFTVTRHVFTEEEQADFDAWDKMSDEAFQLILQAEQEDQDGHR